MTLEQRVEMLEKELKMVREHIAQGRVEMDAFQYLVSKLSAEVIKAEWKTEKRKSELDASEKESNSAECNINFGSNRQVTITDGDGKLRCVLGPFDVETDSAFIKNATIKNAIFSANNFQIASGAETSCSANDKGAIDDNVESILQSALANKKDAANDIKTNNVDSHYDELNKKLDYIISLMPSPQL